MASSPGVPVGPAQPVLPRALTGATSLSVAAPALAGARRTATRTNTARRMSTHLHNDLGPGGTRRAIKRGTLDERTLSREGTFAEMASIERAPEERLDRHPRGLVGERPEP